MKTKYLDQEIEALEDACSRNCKVLWIDKLNEFKAIKEALSMPSVVQSLPFDFIKDFFSLSDEGIRQLQQAHEQWLKRQY